MAKFKVGDRVIGTKSAFSEQCGIKGTITKIMRYNKGDLIPYFVRYDDHIGSYEGEEDIKLIKRGRPSKPKPIKFIVKYEEVDGDPYKEFTSEKELLEWFKEAQKDRDIILDSIEVLPVGKPMKVEASFRLKVE